jgi:anti-anti-sigma factor
MSSQLLIETEQNGDVCTVRISGRMASGSNEDYLTSKAREIAAMSCRHMLVDVRELHSTGSSGLGFLLDLHTHVTRNKNGRMVLVGPQRHVEDVLAITRLSTVIPIAADIDSALAFLASGGGFTATAKS